MCEKFSTNVVLVVNDSRTKQTFLLELKAPQQKCSPASLPQKHQE